MSETELSVLHVIVKAGETNSQYNEHCLPVMHQRKITESQGFELLRRVSQPTNPKLRDIADEVLFTGALPPDATGIAF